MSSNISDLYVDDPVKRPVAWQHASTREFVTYLSDEELTDCGLQMEAMPFSDKSIVFRKDVSRNQISAINAFSFGHTQKNTRGISFDLLNALIQRIATLADMANEEGNGPNSQSRDALLQWLRESGPIEAPSIFINIHGNYRLLWRTASTQFGAQFLDAKTIQFSSVDLKDNDYSEHGRIRLRDLHSRFGYIFHKTVKSEYHGEWNVAPFLTQKTTSDMSGDRYMIPSLELLKDPHSKGKAKILTEFRLLGEHF